MRSLNRLRPLRLLVTGLRRRWLGLRHGIAIHPSASISMTSSFVPGGRGAIEVGAHSLVAFKTLLIAREAGGKVRPIRVGRHCFIGGGATVLPGVTIGDGSVVGAGAVVFDDVPAGSLVAGNPARVLKGNIEVGPYGRFPEADEATLRLYRDA